MTRIDCRRPQRRTVEDELAAARLPIDPAATCALTATHAALARLRRGRALAGVATIARAGGRRRARPTRSSPPPDRRLDRLGPAPPARPRRRASSLAVDDKDRAETIPPRPAGQARPRGRHRADLGARAGSSSSPTATASTAASIGPAGETDLEVQSSALGSLAIPLDSILGLVLAPPPERRRRPTPWSPGSATSPATSEVLWLANGDRLAGGLLGLDDKKVAFQPAAGKVELDRSGVVALGFDPKLGRLPEARGPVPRADPRRRLPARRHARPRRGRARSSATTRSARRSGSRSATWPRSTPATARSSTSPTASRRRTSTSPTSARPGPTAATRAVDGQPLRLGGKVYDRGLGTQSRTLPGLQLEPGVEAVPGPGRARRPRRAARQRGLPGPGRRQGAPYVSPPMSVRERPGRSTSTSPGPRLLILITEFGERGEVQRPCRLGRGPDHPLSDPERPSPAMPGVRRVVPIRARSEPMGMTTNRPSGARPRQGPRNGERPRATSPRASATTSSTPSARSSATPRSSASSWPMPDPPDPAAMADTIIRTALEAAAVARRLIDYTRPSPHRRGPVALDRLVADYVARPRPAEARRRRSGGPPTSPRSPRSAATPTSSASMLDHLRPTPRGRRAGRGDRSLSTSIDARGWVVLEVRDTGRGMEPEVLERAVEPFFSTKPGHLGVGLSIANGIWRRHRGTLSVRSVPGEGPTIRLCVEPIRDLA